MYINAIVFLLNNMQYVFFIINKRTVRSLKRGTLLYNDGTAVLAMSLSPESSLRNSFPQKHRLQGQLKMQDSVTSRGNMSFKFTGHFCGQRPVIIEILCSSPEIQPLAFKYCCFYSANKDKDN